MTGGQQMPEIVDVWLPPEASSYRIAVIAIDKRAEIGTPVQCAEAVSEGILAHLGLSAPKDRWITWKVAHVRLVSPSNIVVNLDDERVSKMKFGYVLDRKVFDKDLATMAADAGAELRLKTRFVSGERLEGGHLDLPRMREGGLSGAFFSVWVDPRKYPRDAAWERALALTRSIREVAERHPIEAEEVTDLLLDHALPELLNQIDNLENQWDARRRVFHQPMESRE